MDYSRLKIKYCMKILRTKTNIEILEYKIAHSIDKNERKFLKGLLFQAYIDLDALHNREKRIDIERSFE